MRFSPRGEDAERYRHINEVLRRFSYGSEVRLATGIADWQKNLLTDPQTSGGLLVGCSPESEAEVLALFDREGFGDARRIGGVVAGAGVLVV